MFRASEDGKLYERKPELRHIDIGASGGQNIRFNVDIEFQYFGIPDDVPQHYSAKYQYDHQRQQLEGI